MVPACWVEIFAAIVISRSHQRSTAQQVTVAWVHPQVHAEGEAEHAAIGHAAVVGFVPSQKQEILRRAMMDHDRDFAVFYNALADMFE